MDLRSIIVDDEQQCVDTLSILLNDFCDGVEVVGTAHNVKSAYELILKKRPDIVFLDVEMPYASGFTLFEYFDNDIFFETIFTTAHDQYALKAFKFSALDYLLKPVRVRDLRDALGRVRKKKESALLQRKYETFKSNMESKRFEKIALPVKEGFLFVEVENIVRCQADANYTIVFLKSAKKILVSRTLKEFEEILTEANFFRTHKSHLVNLAFVRKFIRSKVSLLEMEDGSSVEVATRRRDKLLRRLTHL